MLTLNPDLILCFRYTFSQCTNILLSVTILYNSNVYYRHSVHCYVDSVTDFIPTKVHRRRLILGQVNAGPKEFCVHLLHDEGDHKELHNTN